MSGNIKKGLFWSAIERFSVQGIHFLMTIIISRYVLPEEYGLIAMLAIFIAIANSLIDSGFSSALIQKNDRTETDYSTVFYFNFIVSIGLYFFLWFLSPYIANFYQEPRLELLTKIIGVNLIIRSIGIIQNAKLTIALDFKTISKASFIGAIMGGVIGVIMAIQGMGVWALITQTLISSFVQTFLLWIYTKWIPLFIFSKSSFSKLFSFGSKLLVSGILHTLYLNMYTLVIGKFYNISDVGYFNRANSLAQYPSNFIIGIANRVYYPILCEKQNDVKEFDIVFYQYLRMACFIIFPLSIGMITLARPLIISLLTEQWSGAIIPLQIIACAYILYPIIMINNQPFLCLNNTGLFLKLEIIKKIVAVLFLFIAINFDYYILCLSILLYNVFDVIITVYYVNKFFSASFIKQIKKISDIALSSIMMGVVVFLFVLNSPFNASLTLIIGIFICVISYFIVNYVLKIEEFIILMNNIYKYKQKI